MICGILINSKFTIFDALNNQQNKIWNYKKPMVHEKSSYKFQFVTVRQVSPIRDKQIICGWVGLNCNKKFENRKN